MTVRIDRDQLELEHEPAEPFAVTLGECHYVLKDIRESNLAVILHAEEAASNGDLSPWLDLVVADDDRGAFFASILSTGALARLRRAYVSHFGSFFTLASPFAHLFQPSGSLFR